MKNTIDLFIVGYPRSGTTLTATLLSKHSEVFIPAETHFFRNFLPKLSDNLSDDDICHLILNDDRLKDLNSDSDLVRRAVKNNTNREKILGELLNNLATRENKHIIGEKTPGHILNYHRILNAYPDAKFLIVMRDGRDCVFSNIKESWTFNNPRKHAAEWNYYISFYKEIIKSHPEKVKLIRYEDLIETPQETLSNIAAFIGIKFENTQLNPSQEATAVPEWEKNWKQKATEKPDKNNKYKWKEHPDKTLVADLTYIMKNNLKAYHYDISPIQSYGLIRRIVKHIRNFLYTPKIYPIAKYIAATKFYKFIKVKY